MYNSTELFINVYIDNTNMTKEDPPTIKEIVESRVDDKVFFKEDGSLITIDDLMQPPLSLCNNCPIRTTCPVYKEGSHCRIEEAMVYDAVKNIVLEHDQDVTVAYKYVFYDWVENLLIKHRLARVGATIDYASIAYDEVQRELLDKHVKAMTSVSRRYMEGLKEMGMTPREKSRMSKGNKSQGSMILAQHMKKVIAEEEREKQLEEEKDKEERKKKELKENANASN